MKFKNNKHTYLWILVIALISFISCKKWVEVAPPITSSNGENVFTENQSAIAVLTGIYTNMANANVATIDGWLTNICYVTGLTGDELRLLDPADQQFGAYLSNDIPAINYSWTNIYTMIFIANSAIEKLPNGTLLDPAVKDQLLGEAKFIRALNYFYLVNLYGDVPLALTPDYKINKLLGRTDKAVVNEQIITDLKDAQALMSKNYIGKDGLSTTAERLRPNKWAAIALLARVYLYLHRYADAETQSTDIINNQSLFKLVGLDSVFLKNNNEAIWQLQPTGTVDLGYANTQEGIVFNLPAGALNSTQFTYLSDSLVNSFDTKDLRKTKWIGNYTFNARNYYYPNKYKIGFGSGYVSTEYSTVFRLGEQYLIRAEARIQQGNITGGIDDLNTIRLRATDLSAPVPEQFAQLPNNLSPSDAALAVENERKFELFTEWGHRWMDLKRTNRIDAVLMPVKPGYQTTDQLFPLPIGDIKLYPNLVGHQNPGY